MPFLLAFLSEMILFMKPEIADLGGKARTPKPAMHHWYQIDTTEHAGSRLTTFKETHLIFHRTLLVIYSLQGRPQQRNP